MRGSSNSAHTQQSQPFRFSTKYTHDRSGLTFFGARWYEAGSARWINRDPIGEEGGMNLYDYLDDLLDRPSQRGNKYAKESGRVITLSDSLCRILFFSNSLPPQ
jgi:RHS repeat-associated protein